jgi:hypothetical protein
MNIVSTFMKILVQPALYLLLLVFFGQCNTFLKFQSLGPASQNLKFCFRAWIETYKLAFLELHKIRIINGILLFWCCNAAVVTKAERFFFVTYAISEFLKNQLTS